LAAKSAGIRQKDISRDTGISQGQVSRVISGETRSNSKAFQLISRYVFMHTNPISLEKVRENHAFIEALASVWDGSDHHAQYLVAVIKTLRPFRNQDMRRLAE